MSQMTKAEIEAAMDQITNCVVSVKLHRLRSDEIEELARPRKRRAKKRYSTLDFNDDNEYFEKACSHEVWYPKSKRKYNRTKRRRKNENDMSPEEQLSASFPTFSDFAEKSSKESDPCLRDLETFHIKEEVDSVDQTSLAPIKTEQSTNEQQTSTFVPKLHIKSAYELGSKIIFVDIPNESETDSKFGSYQPVLSDLIANDAEPKLTESSASVQYNIHTIANLYREFFTKDNQKAIKKVAEVLQNLAENIQKRNDRLTEITNSRSTDAQKLMQRHRAHNEFNRVRDTNQSILKKQFEIIGNIFNDKNFEILFQLFFLGILKMFIVSVANKKGTLFKKIVSLLSQSLSNCNYQNERVLNLLKSRDFRANCIALVHFIEKYSETKFFNLLFISAADKKKILNAKNAENPTNTSNMSPRPSFLSTKAMVPCVMKYAKGMVTKPVGNNLLLQHPAIMSTSLSKADSMKTGTNKKASKLGVASAGSTKTAKFPPPYQISSTAVRVEAANQPNLNTATSLSCALNYLLSSVTSSNAPLSSCPVAYTVANSTGNTSFNALPNVTLTSPCSNVQSSYTFSSSSSIQPISTLSVPGSSVQPTIPSTMSISTATPSFGVPSSWPAVVATNYVPIAPHPTLANGSHSVIVASSSPVSFTGNSAMVVPPPYSSNASIADVAVAAQGILQPALPPIPLSSPQLLPPVIPPLPPQSVGRALTETVASDYRSQHLCGTRLGTTNSNQNKSGLKTYGVAKSSRNESTVSTYSLSNTVQNESILQTSSAEEMNKKVQHLAIFDQNNIASAFNSSLCTNSSTLATPARSTHHFIAPRPREKAVASAVMANISVGGGFSSYRTISPAGNSENIQPISPHNHYQNSVVDCSSLRLNEHSHKNCPTTTTNDGLALRTLLMDSGRVPLVNQNGPIETMCQYTEKIDYSTELPSAMSSNVMFNDTLMVPNHLSMSNYVGNTFPC